jgi:alkanesulfonate monooxygenase SsuD/methylene tetrahydromethanopterin reductase-like flavin-dependent oxidoreductase (luciferase family)
MRNEKLAANPNPFRDSWNKVKLGVFAVNGPGAAFTHHPDRFKSTWETQVRLAQMTDALGFEGFVSASRWKPFGGDGHYSGDYLETYSWAAGIAAVTKRVCVMSTVHMTILHPVVAAKMAASVDLISNGRLGMNLVCGWVPAEMEMFGESLKQHPDRYAVGEEWIQIFSRLFAERKSFDFDGRYYKLKGAIAQPHPVQQRPFLMNAGGSARGMEFATKNADVAFIVPQSSDPQKVKQQVDNYRDCAREKYGREILIGMSSYVVQRDSAAEAEVYVQDYVVTQGDDPPVNEFIEVNVANAQTMPEYIMRAMSFAIKAGYGGYPLTGTADDIAQKMQALSEIGVDLFLVTWLDYAKGLTAFAKEVLPRLEKMGLRTPAAGF